MKLPQFSPRIWLAICAFLLSIIVILGIVLAKGPHHHRKGGSLTAVPKLGKIHRLNLPAEQKQQVRALFKEHRRSHRVIAKQLRQVERRLQRALVDPATTEEQLRSHFSEISANQRALQQSRFTFTLRLRQLIGAANMRPLYRHLRRGKKHGDHRGGDRDDRDDRDGHRR